MDYIHAYRPKERVALAEGYLSCWSIFMHIYTNGIKSGKLREVSVKHASIGKIFIKLEEFFKDHKRLSSFWAITEVRDQSFCINHVGHFSDDSLTKIANETILQFSEYFNQQGTALICPYIY